MLGNDFRSMKRHMFGLGFFAVIINLVFWLGLIAGGLWLLKYFQVF